MKTRRDFITQAPLGLLGLAVATRINAAGADDVKPPPGTPSAFNTAPAVGPEVTPTTFAEAEKLAQVTLTPAQRVMAAANWRTSMASMLERRTGPRKVALEASLQPATVWNPTLPGHASGPAADRFLPSTRDPGPLPANDADIAFAPVTHLSHWVRARQLSSTRLTQIYLARIKRFDPQLRCVITLLEDHALGQAAQADREIAAGQYRGPLHGIPFGVKDLLDTAGIRTTYGAEPFRDRVPTADATVVSRLNAAGAHSNRFQIGIC